MLNDLEPKAAAGEAFSQSEADRVLACTDLVSVGTLGELARRARHGDVVTFAQVLIVDGSGSPGGPGSKDVPSEMGAATEVRITAKPASIDEACAQVRAVTAAAGGRTVTGFSVADLLELTGGDHLKLAEAAGHLRDAGLAGVAFLPVDRFEEPAEIVRALIRGGLLVSRATVDHAGTAAERLACILRVAALQDDTSALRAFAPLPRFDEAESPSTGSKERPVRAPVVSPKIRLGSVNYLNCRPLVHGVGGGSDPLFTLRFDPPSQCAALLDAGEIDLGLIPTIAYGDRPGDCIVPGVAIASEGPVASVALFTRVPVSGIRSVALDTSSRTSVGLTRILCARRFGIAPAFAPHAPDLAAMLADHDAALLIGDAALLADYRAIGAEGVDKIDLGQVWTEMTGLPFVWAFWAGRAGAMPPAAVRRLQDAKDAGVRVSDALADDYVSGTPQHRDLARHYLRENIRFDLTDRMLEGLRTYYREAASLGLIAAAPEPLFFAD